jgi:hypothetical protein
MMGVITEDRPPIHILRRLPIVKKLLDEIGRAHV